MKKLYKASEIAKMLGVHVKTVYKWGKEGTLETVRYGGVVRFVMEEGKANGVCSKR